MKNVIYACALLGIFMLSTHFLQAQTERYSASYLGGYISHPGLKLSYDRPFKVQAKTTRKGKEIQSEWMYGASLGSYFHRRNHSSVQLLPHLGFLHTRASGFQFGASLGAGYQRTFIANSYQVSETNEVEKNLFSGQHLFAINPAIHIGKQLKDSPLSWFIKPQLLLSAPYFEGMNTYLLVEAGLSYSLSK